MFLVFTMIASLALAATPSLTSTDTLAVTKPGEQANTVKLESFRSFGGIFSLGGGAVRIVAIVSPTCPSCQAGMDGIADIMRRHPTHRLRAYIGVEPMHDGDTVFAMLRMAGRFIDRRIAYFWDPDKLLGNAYRPIVGLDKETDGIAWHVYFLYDTKARFLGDVPATPDMWMHQHDDIKGAPLDLSAFEARIEELLDQLEDEKRGNSE